MKIVKHTFAFTNDNVALWSGEIEYKNKVYYADMCYFPTENGKGYYLGFLKNDKKFFPMSCFNFGGSNYIETCKYILESIKKVIKGDYSKVSYYGTCISTPTDY